MACLQYPEYLIRYYRGRRDPKRTPYKKRSEVPAPASAPKASDDITTWLEIVQPSAELPNSIDNVPPLVPGIFPHGIWEFDSGDVNTLNTAAHVPKWQAYEATSQAALETAHNSPSLSSKLVTLTCGNWEYEIDVYHMVQINKNHPARTRRAIRRRMGKPPGAAGGQQQQHGQQQGQGQGQPAPEPEPEPEPAILGDATDII
eukprot:COSAG06_NODE_3894_length_4796_cov_13.479881_1_plen_202_part_00